MITFDRLGQWQQWGRLGNQLFQVAAVIGLAKKYNDYAIFPRWEKYYIFKKELHQTNILPPIKYTYKEPAFHYQEIPYQKDMNISGYFQSYKYFDFCKEDIIDQFDLKDEYREIITSKYKYIDFNKTCSIGVRRSDYLQKSKFHTNLTINYYNTALDIIKPDTVIVVSDDIKYCQEVLFRDRPGFIFSDALDFIDLFIQTYCKFNIIANSTFHWWGAYLNQHPDNKVVYPTEWFGPDGKYQDTKDLFLPQWIGINTI